MTLRTVIERTFQVSGQGRVDIEADEFAPWTLERKPLSDQASALKQELLGSTCRVERREADWLFWFGDSRSISVECRWRIVSSEGIALTDEDDGQQFGLPAPIDAEARANALLSGAEIMSADLALTTADLALSFSNGHRLQLINNSSGYEAWNVGRIIALGGGGSPSSDSNVG